MEKLELRAKELQVEELEVVEQMGLPDWAIRTIGVAGMAGLVYTGVCLT